jgi:hypothetical protein
MCWFSSGVKATVSRLPEADLAVSSNISESIENINILLLAGGYGTTESKYVDIRNDVGITGLLNCVKINAL